ncbi:MAG: aminotransferase class I/II-fold pyridoxal phosphate-dependent enzyme [Firmicutes bacterium]|nr:aminotransferase class I/II-fold pyridoxal phosphate-dependent enzyme [Bacillota bacterium]
MKGNIPLYHALIDYVKKRKLSFHMPGHQQGKGIPRQFKRDILSIDLTELDGTDNLHAPAGPIREAQQMASAAFGAQHSFLLVNGATCGIQAMIASVCNPGDVLIVDRNCHSSVISALILCGVTPRYVYPEYIPALGLIGGMNPGSIESALNRYPEAKGVMITSPTYYGLCSDLYAIAEIVHRHDKVFLVDEAHGAHFCFHEGLPQSALQAKADMCVQGAHKTLPALTQSAFLHVGSDKVDLERLKNCLRLFQSSSPSFILMAYLDIGRSIMADNGHALLDKQLYLAEELRNSVNRMGKAYCLGKELMGNHYICDMDLTRGVINFIQSGLTGYRAADELNTKYDIQVEMADIYNIVSIVSAAHSEENMHLFAKAINDMACKTAQKGRICRSAPARFFAEYAVSPREAAFKPTETLELKKADNRICADTITCFPPGIPILCPGEVISYDMIHYILNLKDDGGKVLGISDDLKIRVLKI